MDQEVIAILEHRCAYPLYSRQHRIMQVKLNLVLTGFTVNVRMGWYKLRSASVQIDKRICSWI